MKEGDIILIEKENEFQCFSTINFITPEEIGVGVGSFNRKKESFHFRSSSKGPKIIEGCHIGSKEEAERVLTEYSYRESLMNEVYFFFNNDPEKDHLDPDIMDGAMRAMKTEELEALVKTIIPYKRGEYGFSTIEQVKEESKKNLGSYNIIYLQKRNVFYKKEEI